MAKSDAEGGGKSITWVIAMVMFLILGGSWIYAASDYFQHEGQGSRDMWGNAIAQIPNLPAVMGFVFKNRIWLVLVVLVAEGLALGFGLFMKKVERDLNAPRRR